MLAAMVLLPVTATPLAARSVAGEVVSSDAEARQLTVITRHGEKTFAVRTGDAAIYAPGDMIRGEAMRFGEGERLEQVWPDGEAARNTLKLMAADLRRDTLIRGRHPFRGMGEHLPSFALWDDRGELFQSSELRGGYVVVNFIFTRCRDPRMCPLATRLMSQIQDEARAQGLEDQLQLVSISFDPDYDTPGVLYDYARDRGIEPQNFRFLTGPIEPIRDLKAQLGILVEPDDEEIWKHTAMTVVADPEQKIIFQVPGTAWAPSDILSRIERDIRKRTEGDS